MPSEPQVTVRTTEAGRITDYERGWADALALVAMCGIERATSAFAAIRQPGGPDVVALAGERLRIAAGRVERVQS